MQGTGVAIQMEPYETMKRFDQLIGESKQMQEVRRVIQKVSQVVLCPILILGESGTGKEMIARLIHARGPSNEKPFLVVDCGLPANLIEAELFGSQGQAIGDSCHAKERLSGLAGGGTLFLNEKWPNFH